MTRRERVLLTGGEEIGVLGATRGLARAGYETWVASLRPGSFAARSRSAVGAVIVPDPADDPPRFAQAVAEAAEDLSVAAVLPGTESALIALAGRESLFSPGALLGAPAPEVVDRATDKVAFLDIADRAGLATPPTQRLRGDDLATTDIPFPAVVKPLRSEQRISGGKLRHTAPRLVSELSGARTALAGYPGGEGLLQPYLPGEIYGFCGVAWNGELVCSLHQVGERIWPVDCGMVSYARTVERDPRLEESVASFIGEVRWSGVFQIQFIRHEGRLYAIDLNPRVYISIALALAAGLNLAAIWAELVLGRRPEIPAYRTGVRWRSDQDDPRAIAWELLRGSPRKAARGLLPRRRTVHAVFSWRDPAPSVESLKKLIVKVFRRSGRTRTLTG